MMTPIERAQAVADAQEILGVATHATEVELRSAWKKLAFEMHPDRGSGTSHELANINAAYNLLKNRSRQAIPEPGSAFPGPASREPANSNPAKKPASNNTTRNRVHPRRVASARTTGLTASVAAECRRILDDGGNSQADHLPDAIRRSGREIEYLVKTQLAKGVNRIALPVCDYRGTRQSTIRRITFSASDSGSGTFTIPDHLRRDLFPGARTVRIHFAKSKA